MSRKERAWVCAAITAGLLEGTVRLMRDATAHLLEHRYYDRRLPRR